MLYLRTGIRGSLTLVGVMLLMLAAPQTGWGISLSSPANGYDSHEGDEITFEWSGALEGDADAIDRSFFRVEMIESGDPWTSLASYTITDPGVAATSAKLGTPDKGDYKWRVCAWGVVDDLVDNTLESISCSSSRNLTALDAESTTRPAPSTVTQDGGTITLPGPTRHVTETTTTDSKASSEPKVIEKTLPASVAKLPEVVTADTDGLDSSYGTGGSSAVGLGDSGGAGGLNGSGGGALGALGRGLGSSIPGVPIPFWSLLLLLVALPLAGMWRKSTLAMFDWPREQGGDMFGADASEMVKVGGEAADGANDQPTAGEQAAA
jgi:hypothetical protein